MTRVGNSVRRKNCERCQKDFDTMYRASYKAQKNWVFLCKSCLLAVKNDNIFYRYGGTWKR